MGDKWQNGFSTMEVSGEIADTCWITDGYMLNREKAFQLSLSLRRDPNNLAIRLQLLGYYDRVGCEMPRAKTRQKHILWMINNHPTAYLCDGSWMMWDMNFPRFFNECRALWLRHVADQPDNARIMYNAGISLYLVDTVESLRYVKIAVELLGAEEYMRESLSSMLSQV